MKKVNPKSPVEDPIWHGRGRRTAAIWTGYNGTMLSSLRLTYDITLIQPKKKDRLVPSKSWNAADVSPFTSNADTTAFPAFALCSLGKGHISIGINSAFLDVSTSFLEVGQPW
jgi:hypothetical protein